MDIPINYLAVLACGVASMILGFLWYGPVFGKAWMKSMGKTMPSKEEMKAMGSKMTLSYVKAFIGGLVMAYVFAHALVFAGAYMNDMSVSGGLMGAFWMWLGFVAPVLMAGVLWEGKTWKWWVITSGYYLVLLGIFSVILVSWTA